VEQPVDRRRSIGQAQTRHRATTLVSHTQRTPSAPAIAAVLQRGTGWGRAVGPPAGRTVGRWRAVDDAPPSY
jgi:hypothetical protein